MSIPYIKNPFGAEYILGDVSAFKIEITATDITNGINYHAFNLTGVSGCKIYWGDTTYTNYNASGLYSHTYTSAGIYLIQIKGTHSTFNHYSATSNTTPTKVIQAIKLYSGITSCTSMFRGCNNAKFVLHWGFRIGNSVLNCSAMFNGCNNANFNLPSMFRLGTGVTNCNTMFQGCSGASFTLPAGFTIPNNVTSTYGMFRQCSGNAFLLPSGFTLSSNETTIGEMFYQCTGNAFTSLPASFVIPASCRNMEYLFYGCSKLTADISNIFPTWASGISMAIGASFVGSKVTGTAPADKLWNRTDITWFVYSMIHPFTDVTTLTNYASIPAGWK